MAEDSQTLHWADYLVFGLFLGITTIVGVVIGVVNRRKATSKEFLQAGGEMHFFPVAMSMQASFLSAIFVVSIPAESYNFGIGYGYIIISYFISFPLMGKLILPIFFRLKITSAYEYLELRFNKIVRTAASITFLLQMLLYISVVIYTPALSIQQVTPLPTYACILLVSGVCIIYTVIGGMRATIWNDLIQMVVVMACMLMLIAFGHRKTGTLKEVYFIIQNGSRLNFDIFAPDPRQRTSFWTQVVGGTFLNLAMYGASQTIIQKALSTKSIDEANKSLKVLSVTSAITMAMVMWIGLVMYAHYADCDPQLAGTVDKPDQIVPKFMMDVMGHLHGLPGLFMASTFSGALSSVSGGLNSMAAVVLVDLVGPVYRYKTGGRDMPDRMSSILSRVLALIIGLIVMGLSFATPSIGDLILTIALSIFGMVGGPLFGLLCAGLFTPCVNPWGALTGLIVALGLTLWLGIGTMLDGPPLPFLPHSIDGCEVPNDTFTMTTSSYGYGSTDLMDLTTSIIDPGGDDVLGFYKVSYMYYGLIAIFTTIIVAVIVSAMSGFSDDVPYEHIYSCADTCCSCCPTHVRDCCRCGSFPPDDDADAPEVLKVHFKTRTGSDVPGVNQPGQAWIRQVSFTLNNPDDEVFDPDVDILDKRKQSLHTTLYRKDSGNEHDIVLEVLERVPPAADQKHVRQDSGIIMPDSDKDSDRTENNLGGMYSSHSNSPANSDSILEMREKLPDISIDSTSSSLSRSSRSSRSINSSSGSSSSEGHINHAFVGTTSF